MAIGQTSSTESVKVYEKYSGVSSVRLVAVNPTAKEIAALFGSEEREEPVYVEKDVEYKDPVTEQTSTCTKVRLDFYLKDEDVDQIFVARFNMIDKPFKSKSGKVKVIDKYGQTCWVTAEQYKGKEVPMYSNGPAKIDLSSWKPSYRNEEEIVSFFRAYLNVPTYEVFDKTTNSYVVNPNPASAVLSLDKIQDYFKGDFSELKGIVKLGTQNKIKVCLGVREYEGKLYQDVFTQNFIKNMSQPDIKTGEYVWLKKKIEEAQANGAYANTHFTFTDVHVFDGIRSIAGANQSDAVQNGIFGESSSSHVVDDPFSV